ncbi:MAG: GntR family transcriptional regulator [Candidatus Eremiobacteraeota bacterium]|nr:GntR family transcriptional regulator [Candidatus Eremiobacteraeota bacterium]MBV8365876.1 GntR family transcriptional regulator [Candidatus Eremiobacteraeota bacterium]
MPAIFTVDPRSGVPIYLQIMEQVKRSVALGVLAPGEQLPTVKQLAADLIVNPNTVARAYRELERDQVIETMAGRGSFIAGSGTVAGAKRAVADVADQAIVQAVREGKSMGLARDEMKVLFEHALDRWYPTDASEENAAS